MGWLASIVLLIIYLSVTRRSGYASKEFNVDVAGPLQIAWMLGHDLDHVREPSNDELRKAGMFKVSVHSGKIKSDETKGLKAASIVY